VGGWTFTDGDVMADYTITHTYNLPFLPYDPHAINYLVGLPINFYASTDGVPVQFYSRGGLPVQFYGGRHRHQVITKTYTMPGLPTLSSHDAS
jgi:hypothetical protein